jgi:hypothetical protein
VVKLRRREEPGPAKPRADIVLKILHFVEVGRPVQPSMPEASPAD